MVSNKIPIKEVAVNVVPLPSSSEEKSIYERVGGEARLRLMVDLFYDEMDNNPEFSLLRSIHHGDLNGARDKLFWFLSGLFGGPSLYIERFGHPRLRARHLPFPIGIRERDEWLGCMDRALLQMNFEEPLLLFLRSQFFKTADWMRNKEG